MPAEHVYSFLVAVFVVFFMGGVFTLLADRPGAADPMGGTFGPGADEESPLSDVLEELAEKIEQDEELLSAVTPLKVPHIELPGALAGGGATAQSFSKAAGVISLDVDDSPDENREYDRRMTDRRASEVGVDQDRRIVERRIWLRRKEDEKGKRLLTITDAADTLGVPVERIYQWLDKTDIPFYQTMDGKNKAIRFDIDELLQWYSAFCASQGGK